MLAKFWAYKFATQIQGVPFKFLEAMAFDIPKASDDRFKNLRTLTCSIQDRLEDVELKDFVRDISFLKEKVSSLNNLSNTPIHSYSNVVFSSYSINVNMLAIEDRILDLVPLMLKVDMQELLPEHFQDEFDRIDSEIRNEYSCFLYNRAGLFQPQNKSLTDYIQYKRKYQRVQHQEEPIPEFIKQIDSDLMNTLLPVYQIDNTETDQQQLLKNNLLLSKNNRLLGKQVKLKEEQESKTLLYIKQLENDTNIIPSSRICLYGLPYMLDEKYREELKIYLEQRFGKISSIEFQEYSNFKRQLNLDKEPLAEESSTFSKDFDAQKRTKKLLERIKKNKNRKLFKSYVIVKFENMEAKSKALAQDLRLFGIKFKDIILRIDDSDPKNLLYVNNLPKHSTVQQFISYLNLHLGTEFEPQDERVTLQNNMVCLILKNFDETLRVLEIFQNHSFSRFKMNLFHYPDGLKYLGCRVTEHFTSNAAIQILKLNLNSIRYQLDDQWIEEYVKEEVKSPVLSSFISPSPQQIEIMDMIEAASQSEDDFQLEIFGLVWDEETASY